MKTRIGLLLLTVLLIAALLSSCAKKEADMKDGYYTAESASFDDNGWKEYITIYVGNGKILTVDYDAYNASGFARSWDINYMRSMISEAGTYPNEYTRTYAISLINWQDPSSVDAVTGATGAYTTFQMLAEAAIAQAKKGDKQVAPVDLSGGGPAEG